MQFLYEQDMLKELSAYGGWNTSSNTLGTVLSHLGAWNAAERLGRLTGEAREASEEFLFFRYLEDPENESTAPTAAELILGLSWNKLTEEMVTPMAEKYRPLFENKKPGHLMELRQDDPAISRRGR